MGEIKKPFLQIGSFHAAFLGENTVPFPGIISALATLIFRLMPFKSSVFWRALWCVVHHLIFLK